MNILILKETDWLIRGPHIYHHIFERLSKNPLIKVTVLDYDIDNIQKSKSIFVRKRIFNNIRKVIKNSNIKIIRTSHIKVPYLRRISSLITNFIEILRIIKKEHPDIIIGYSITNGLIGLILAKIFHIPYIYHYIDVLHKLVPIKYVQDIARVISRISLKYADQVIVYTKFQQNYIIKEGTPPKRIKFLPNGVSFENTIVDEKKLMKLISQFSISKNDFVIFFMGYLYDFAGLREIIDYYNFDVKNGKFNLKFLILGDGGIYKTLMTHVKEIGADWVFLVGRVPFFDITEYIYLADLCLLSFKINDITKEITPIKVIEYMAMEKPVLSNSLPGVLTEIGKEHGIIFTKNQKDLIEKIGNLIPQKNELKKFGQKGNDFVKEKYSWPKIINELKMIMINLIKRKQKNLTYK